MEKHEHTKAVLNRMSRLTKKELPYTIAMILLDIVAPICLLFGLKSVSAENASLPNKNTTKSISDYKKRCLIIF